MDALNLPQLLQASQAATHTHADCTQPHKHIQRSALTLTQAAQTHSETFKNVLIFCTFTDKADTHAYSMKKRNVSITNSDKHKYTHVHANILNYISFNVQATSIVKNQTIKGIEEYFGKYVFLFLSESQARAFILLS